MDFRLFKDAKTPVNGFIYYQVMDPIVPRHSSTLLCVGSIT